MSSLSMENCCPCIYICGYQYTNISGPYNDEDTWKGTKLRAISPTHFIRPPNVKGLTTPISRRIKLSLWSRFCVLKVDINLFLGDEQDITVYYFVVACQGGLRTVLWKISNNNLNCLG